MNFTEYIDSADDAVDETTLFRRIEAAVAAKAALDGVLHVEASCRELELLVSEGRDAVEEVWRRSLPMVMAAASDRAFDPGRVDDLVGAGCLGLAEAIWRFDHRRGARFATLAWEWIHRRVHEESVIGATSRPVWRRRTELAVSRVADDLSVRHGREASVDEVATAMGRSLKWVTERMVAGSDIGSDHLALVVDAVARERSDPDLGWVVDLLDGLSALERKVIGARHGFDGEPVSLSVLARQLGCSEKTVRRVEARALARMRTMVHRWEQIA